MPIEDLGTDRLKYLYWFCSTLDFIHRHLNVYTTLDVFNIRIVTSMIWGREIFSREE